MAIGHHHAPYLLNLTGGRSSNPEIHSRIAQLGNPTGVRTRVQVRTPELGGVRTGAGCINWKRWPLYSVEKSS
jgi:hypothetical protein